MSYIDKILMIIADTKNKPLSLKQSILRMAFMGRLIPQDPRDEPASVLLDRIKAQRVKQKRLI
jgi:type I restriction enzyme S subunit